MREQPESPPPSDDPACVLCGCSEAKPGPACDGSCPCDEWSERESWTPVSVSLEEPPCT